MSPNKDAPRSTASKKNKKINIEDLKQKENAVFSLGENPSLGDDKILFRRGNK